MSKGKEQEPSISTKGWNWGYYHFKDDKLDISHDKEGKQRCFGLSYKDIAISNASKDFEVVLEFQRDQAEQKRGDILCEMRFFVPNMEGDDQEEDQEVKDQEMKEGEEPKEEEDQITPAKVFNDQILKFAGLGDSAGEIIASFHDLPLSVPRGRYTLDLLKTYAKFHGRTHDYKIMYKDIVKVFQLPRVDRDQTVILIQLGKPLTQGQTMHHFIMIQTDNQPSDKIKIHLTPEELQKEYGSSPGEDDMLHEVLAKMLRTVANIDRIIIPGDFRSGVDDVSQAIACSVKVSEGFLYPLKTSLIFFQKPIMYIKHKEIKYVQFSRIGNTAGGTGRSFDLSIVNIDSDSNTENMFKNIDKKELKAVMKYFKDANIKMRQIDSDTNKARDMNDFNSDELDEEIRQSQVEEKKTTEATKEPIVTVGRSGRRRIQKEVEMVMDEDYDDEDSDDESFGENAENQSESGGEDGEEDMEDDIDEEIDKAELKILKGNKIHDKKERKKK